MSSKKLSFTIFAEVVLAWWLSGTALADDASAKQAKSSSSPSTAASTTPKANPASAPRGPKARPWEPPPDGGPDDGPPPPDDRGGPPGPPPDGGPDGGPGHRPPRAPHDRNGRPEPPPDGPGRGNGEPAGPPSSARWPYNDPESMRTSDPEMYKLMKADEDLDRQSQDLAVQYRQAAPEKRKQIRQQIEQVVDKHFEARQARRSLELKRLKEELQSFQDAIDRRTKARKELVEKRISDLLGSEERPKF